MEEQVIAVIGKQAFDDVEKMLKLLDTAAQKIVEVNNVVKNASVEVKGAKSVEELATKTAKLQTETQGLAAATADYNKIAAETEEVLRDVSGTQADNLRLFAQYKAELAANREAQSKLSKEYKSGRIDLEEYKAKMAVLVEQEQQAKIAQADLTQTIKAGIKEQQAAGGSIDAMSQRLGLLRDAYRKMSAEERASAGGKALLAAIQELDPAVKELDASMGNHQRNVGNYPKTMSGAVAVLEKARAEMMQQIATLDQGSDTYQVLSSQIDHLNQVLDDNATKYLSARTASRELENVSRELAASLGMESDAFKAVSGVAGEFKNDVGDIQAVIQGLSSDTQTLDGVIGAAEGLAGAFSVAEGAAALFGGESEEMQKTMQRLMAAMTIMQGLQAVQNTLQSESAAMMFLSTVQQKASTAAMVIRNFVLTGSTAAINANTAATVRGTFAARAFRTALIGTGIGALIVLLSTAASAMDTFGSSTGDAAEETQKLKEEANELVDALKKVADATEGVRNARAGGLDSLKRELDLMKARGDSAGEIQKKEQAILQGEVRNLRIRAITLATAIQDGMKYNKDVSGLQAELVEINKQGLDKRNEMEVSAAAYQKSLRDEAAKDAKEAADKRKKEQEKLSKELQELRERDQKAAAELLQLSISQQSAFYKTIADDETKTLAERLQATANYYAKEAALIAARAEAAKAEGQKTAKEILLIDAKKEDDLQKLYTESGKGRLALTKDFLEDEVQLRLSSVQKIQENTDSQEQQALRVLAERLRSGNLTVEQYEKERDKIKDQYAKGRNQQTIDYLREEIETLAAQGGDTTALQAKLNEAQNTLYQQDADNFLKSAQKKEEAQRALGEKLKELGQEVFNTIVAMQMSVYESDIRDVDQRIADIDKEKEAQIKAANASALSQQEKQRKIAQAEAEAQAKRETLEARKRQIQLQAARFEKAANIAAIIGETALAVIRALGTKPWTPANIALAAVTGAIGAVQLARALSAPLPQYAKGRKGGPAEFAWVGEEGSELVKHADGNAYLTPGVPTVTYLPAGASVIPHHEVMAMAQTSTMRALAASGAPVTPESYGTALMQQYQLAAGQIVNAINNKTETHLSITERGLQNISKKGDVWTHYLQSNL